jgi:diguanylate cyclase (GGDEF)-like protein/PAS domain S-box-containing protein
MAHERILIVEDQNITAMDIRQIVQQLGYEPIGPVASGNDAVTSALAQRPDVVLMDIMLKGPMDGIQAAEAIRSQYLCPVIYVTAHSDQSTLDRAKLTEPFGYILKPINKRELHTAVEMALCRHKLEQRLRESEERYRTAIECSNDGVVITQEGNHVYVNRKFLEMFGYSGPEEILNRSIADAPHMHPDDVKRIVEWNRQRLNGAAVPSSYEHKAVHKDGRTLHVELSSARITYHGKAASLSYIRDITKRKQAEDALRESEVRFKQLFNTINDGIILRDAVTYELLDANRRFCELYGYTLEKLKRLPLGSLNAQQSVQERREHLVAYYSQAPEGTTHLMRTEARRKDGSTFWVEMNGTKITVGNRPCLLMVVRDITDRKRSEDALAASEERYRRVVESSPIAIFVDCRSRLVFINPAATRLLGAVEPEQLRSRTLLDFVHAESKKMVQGHIDALLQGSQTFLLRNVQLTGLNGVLLDVEMTGIAFDYEGEPAVQLVVHDITEARRMTVQLEHMASHDALTCLPNRIMMRDRLNKALAHARRYGGQATVIFLDLDHFKIINDSLGHDQGDLFLRTIAERLSGSVRELDTVTRFGGDEFVIVLFDQPKDDDALITVLERIQQCIRQPVILGGREYSVSSSMGFAIYPRDGSDAETLLRNADQAMYRAKDQGRGNFQPYSEELYLHVTERLQLHNDLRRALERDEFIVHYQPQADLHDGSIIGVEALVRWRHPDRGLVSPGQFIDAAEETGLITSIGEFVLRTACEQGKAWQDMGLPPLRIAVNLSSRQFWQPDLLEIVERSLRDSGLNPRFLELELTEGLILKSVDDAVRTMRALRTMGVELAIDDFGTGYSSLACLKRFPIGRLKVAQAFLRDIPADPDSVAIARAVISLGHSLKLKVIAEGVETPQQLEFLEAAGCDEIQGYLVSKPLSQGEVTELLKLHLRRANGGAARRPDEQRALP